MTASPASEPSVFALITGGGTGGHVYPALAVAEELVERGHPRATIRFVGSTRGMEASVVPDAGFDIELLPGRGVRRSLRPSALWANAGALIGTARAFGRAFRLVGRLRPSVILGVGGYASLPCLVAGRLRRIPAVVHEQNAAPGLANRVAVRLGARAAVALPGTQLRHAVITGNPVRPAISAVQRRPVSPPLVAIFGGSLGARSVNTAALELCERWRARDDVAVLHVCGRRDYNDCHARYAALQRPDDTLRYDLLAFEDHMARVYASAAVAVCRSGAITVAELAMVGLPAVLVPLPGAPADHQTRNADALVAVGVGVAIADTELDGDRLAKVLDELLADPDRLGAMSAAARSVAHPDAAVRVADLVEEVSRAAA